MTKKDGLNMLRTVLLSMNREIAIDELILYVTGNKKHMSEYANESILTQIGDDIKRNCPFVIKCFIKPEIYVAWHSCVGVGSSKYFASRSSLVDFEENSQEDYRVFCAGDSACNNVYIFRHESGIQKFFEKVLNLKNPENSN